MNVLTFTSLFPSQVTPGLGSFVARRMEAWAEEHASVWMAVAPVPYFPSIPIATRWQSYAQTPSKEHRGRYPVFHPRYLALPGVGTRIQGASMAACVFRSVRRVVRQHGPFDLIDAHYVYPDGFAALKIGRKLRLPVIVSARGSDINVYPDLPGMRGKITWVLRESDALIGVSRALVDRMLTLGAPQHRCYVVPNGVDLGAFSPVAGAEPRSSASHVLAVGNLVPEKGMDRLVTAIHSLVASGANVSLTIVGDGPEEARLRSQIEGLRLQQRIRLLGRVKHEALPGLFQNAGVFCLASSREGCPNVILEALASGLPVAATPVGGVPELIVDGLNGFLASDLSSQGLANALARVLHRSWDPWTIRQTVAHRSWSQTGRLVQAVFEQVAKKRREEGRSHSHALF